MSSPRSAPNDPPAHVGARYRVLAQLGRGGSANVYHVRELASGRELALKRLRDDLHPSRMAELKKHLEREFYALAQLRHPRVIAVFDYGVSEGLPYYTMELLDGGDLRGASPLPWRRACELMYDVASSLALLHSRRFVHRDVTPSNIRCTRDGRAKLIDFGAMVQMGAGAQVVGTPAYVAPEVQQRGVLDACTDLFSLGATLYFTLTGRAAFSVTDLATRPEVWWTPPPAPSTWCADIPGGLDALVLSLLSLDPAQRPRSAFEVMQRLAACAGLATSESAHVPQGYLSAPHVVGRQVALRAVRSRVQRALAGEGGALWIEGEPGVGRSRLLELCVLESKTVGAGVLHLDARVGEAAFAGAERLAQMLRAASPELAQSAPPDSEQARPALLLEWFVGLSAKQPIVIAVDDVQRLDDPSVAFLAALAHRAPHARLLVIVTAELSALRGAEAALGILRRHSTPIPLAPLTRAESDAMFMSIFGSVPNLTLLSERIFTLAAGNPQRSLALAQHLIDQGQIVYASGAFSLPEDLPLPSLPLHAEALLAARIVRLSSLARNLAEAQALSLVAALTRDDYQSLAPGADDRSLDDALSELIAHEVIRGDGQHYVLAHRDCARALLAPLTPESIARRHQLLASLAKARYRHATVVAYHLLGAEQRAEALDLLVGAAESLMADLHGLDADSLYDMLERALALHAELGRPKRERFELMRLMITACLSGDANRFQRIAPSYRAQLEIDSGFSAYRARAALEDHAERLRAALAETQARYLATPAHERVYSVEEALRLLAVYGAGAIAISARLLDSVILRDVPALLEPFVGLSPMLFAIWENVGATQDARFFARPERAFERWQRVYERLETIHGEARVATIRAAVAYGLGELSATLGLCATAMAFIERLDRDRHQHVNAMRVRSAVCLQYGDWAGAERAREQAELLALQASGRQMFEAPLRIELQAHWLARDLSGVKQVADRVARVIQTRPGWRPYHLLAQGYFEALRGDPAGALASFDACVASTEPSEDGRPECYDAWLRASAGAVGMLVELGRAPEARTRGLRVVAQCEALQIGIGAEALHCQLAIAEAMSGDDGGATARIEAVIADQLRRGVAGLTLGASYEARARIARTLGDEAAAARDAALAAHARGVEQSGAQPVPRFASRPAEREPDPELTASLVGLDALTGAARVQRALELLCAHGQASGGHLYLRKGLDPALALAASWQAPPPSAALTRFATSFWQAQLDDAEMSAVLTELPLTQEEQKPFSWHDAAGERYEALVLCDPRAQPSHIGLAILQIAEDRRECKWATRFISALAARVAISRQ